MDISQLRAINIWNEGTMFRQQAPIKQPNIGALGNHTALRDTGWVRNATPGSRLGKHSRLFKRDSHVDTTPHSVLGCCQWGPSKGHYTFITASVFTLLRPITWQAEVCGRPFSCRVLWPSIQPWCPQQLPLWQPPSQNGPQVRVKINSTEILQRVHRTLAYDPQTTFSPDPLVEASLTSTVSPRSTSENLPLPRQSKCFSYMAKTIAKWLCLPATTNILHVVLTT